ncbi:hypothetical protein BAY1663_02829 [Pseudomonas sp. BAY1663]|nr:hypothetical protein BAY1663_02829 [Pseudomonas sp. BAY1663]
MGIEHGVLQLPALALPALRHRVAADLAQRHQPGIHRLQAQQQAETPVRYAAAGGQRIGGGSQALADHQGGGALPGTGQLVEGQPAGGQRVEGCLVEMAVQRAGQVGDQQRPQAEALDALGDEFQVAGCQAGAAQHVDLARPLADLVTALGHQRLDHRLERGGETALEATAEVRAVHRHHGHVAVLGIFAAELMHGAVQVAALGLRQRGAEQADHRWMLLVANGAQRLDHVLVGAHHRADLIHRRGLQRHRLAEVPDEEHLGERRAALRTVQQRHAARQAEEGQRGAHGLAGLQRADRQRLVAVDDLCHRDLLRRSPAYGVVPRPTRRAAPTAPAGAPPATPGSRGSGTAGAPVPACRRSRHSRIRVPG